MHMLVVDCDSEDIVQEHDGKKIRSSFAPWFGFSQMRWGER
jgi:hypothetical protein